MNINLDINKIIILLANILFEKMYINNYYVKLNSFTIIQFYKNKKLKLFRFNKMKLIFFTYSIKSILNNNILKLISFN